MIGAVLVAACTPAPPAWKKDPTAIVGGLTDPVDLVIGTQYAYWLSEPPAPTVGQPPPGSLRRVSLAGGDPQTLVSPVQSPVALARDAAHLYWVDLNASGKDEIRTAAHDGTGATVLATLHDPVAKGTRLAVASGTLYWGGVGGIHSLPVSGGQVGTVVPAQASSLTGTVLLAADASGLYWSDTSTSAGTKVRHAALDGTGVATLVDAAPLEGPQGFTEDGQHAFWIALVSATDAGIFAAPRDGGSVSKVVDGPNGGALSSVVADAAGLYFGDGSASAGGLYRVQGSRYTALHRLSLYSSGTPVRLRLDAAHLYWVDGGASQGSAVLHAVGR